MDIVEFTKDWARRDLTEYEIGRLRFLDKCRVEFRTPVLVSADKEAKTFLIQAMGAYMRYLETSNMRGVLKS